MERLERGKLKGDKWDYNEMENKGRGEIVTVRENRVIQQTLEEGQGVDFHRNGAHYKFFKSDNGDYVEEKVDCGPYCSFCDFNRTPIPNPYDKYKYVFDSSRCWEIDEDLFNLVMRWMFGEKVMSGYYDEIDDPRLKNASDDYVRDQYCRIYVPWEIGKDSKDRIEGFRQFLIDTFKVENGEIENIEDYPEHRKLIDEMYHADDDSNSDYYEPNEDVDIWDVFQQFIRGVLEEHPDAMRSLDRWAQIMEWEFQNNNGL